MNIEKNRNLNYLEISVGPFCKKNCLFCSEGGYGKRDFVSIEKFIKLIGKNKLRKIVLTGGEPLLNPRIHEYIRICKSNNIFVSIVTALEKSFSNEKLYELIKLGLDELMISLEGPEKIHDFLVREKGAYKNIINNLYFLRNINRQNLRVIIHSNINKINYKVIPFFINKILNNFPFIFTYHIQMLEPLGNAFKNKNILFDKYSVLLEYFFKNLNKIVLKDKIKIGRLPYCIIPEEFDFLISETPKIYEYNDLEIEEGGYYGTKYISEKCKKCLKFKYCDMFFKYYIDIFGDGEIKCFK